MFNADNEFEKLNQKVKIEEEKYLNSEVTIDNYKFPHIYLTEEEIEQFNKECEQYGIDIKVVPLSTYMNLNSTEKINNSNEDDEIDLEQKEKDIDKFMNYLGKNFQKKEDKKENKFIGKKRNKILEDDSEQEESNISSFKSKSHVRKRIKKNENEDDEISEKSNISENMKRKKYDYDIEVEEEKSSGKKDIKEKGNKKKRKLIKKKKNLKKTNEMSEKFENYFKKIKETRQRQIYDIERKSPLIEEILEKSQLLTKEELKAVAKANHIGLIDDSTLSKNDLNKKDTNQLEKIFVDININSNVIKLNVNGEDNIKKLKDRMEKVKKSEEDREKNKRLKELKRTQLLNEKMEKSKSYHKKEDKKEIDNSDIDSDSDDDLI